MSEFDLLPDQPSTPDQVRRFGPPAIIGIVALLFIFQNTDSTEFNFLWFDFRFPLWGILLVFMAIGALVFWGAARRRRSRKKKAAKLAEQNDET